MAEYKRHLKEVKVVEVRKALCWRIGKVLLLRCHQLLLDRSHLNNRAERSLRSSTSYMSDDFDIEYNNKTNDRSCQLEMWGHPRIRHPYGSEPWTIGSGQHCDVMYQSRGDASYSASIISLARVESAKVEQS